MSDPDLVSYFTGNSLCRDLFDVVRGDWLGTGVYREVYRCHFDNTLVFKFETDTSKHFANVTEWKLWQEVEFNNKLNRWLAPCVAISASGNVLVQRFCADVHAKMLPKKIPAWMADTKLTNWGEFEGRCVARDYGNNHALDKGLSSRLVKAHW